MKSKHAQALLDILDREALRLQYIKGFEEEKEEMIALALLIMQFDAEKPTDDQVSVAQRRMILWVERLYDKYRKFERGDWEDFI